MEGAFQDGLCNYAYKEREAVTVQFDSQSGLEAIDDIAGDMIEELQNKKMEAAKEVSVDTAIGMLESFCFSKVIEVIH